MRNSFGGLEDIDLSFGKAFDFMENTDSDEIILYNNMFLDGFSWIKETCIDFFLTYHKIMDKLNNTDPSSKNMLIKLLKSTEKLREMAIAEYEKSINNSISVSFAEPPKIDSGLSTLMELIKKYDEIKHEELKKEHDIIRSQNNVAMLFTSYSLNKETKRSYAGHFEYSLEKPAAIIGLGFGICENPEDFCIIRDITFMIDDQNTKTITPDFAVPYAEGRKSCIFYLPEVISLKNKFKVYFFISTEGTGNYVFRSFFEKSRFKRIDISDPECEEFPILYFVLGN